jgi:hypothetical protein
VKGSRSLAAAVLLAQLSGLAHLALSAHDLGERGEAFEQTARRSETHAAERSHLCASSSAPAPELEQCLVVSAWRAAARAGPTPALCVSSASLPAAPTPRALEGRPPVAALVLAPKSSPPGA